MTPTTRTAVILFMTASLVLVAPVLVLLAWIVLVGMVASDVRGSGAHPRVTRTFPRVIARGRPMQVSITADATEHRIVKIRQPTPADVELKPAEGIADLGATLTASRRGQRVLGETHVRTQGPLGLMSRDHKAGGRSELLVYPDVPGARRLARAARTRGLMQQGRARGSLGLGTQFESIRDYLPDDDFRQVNWLATARTGRAMSNQYRTEEDRDVIALVDAGRLMGAPLEGRTRLDVALDAITAVAVAGDEVGDRCGAVAFDETVLRSIAPRRKGATAVVRSLFDLEPSGRDSDYERAFMSVAVQKRALLLVFTDIIDRAAADSLLRAIPLVARRHSVTVISASDVDLLAAISEDPGGPLDVYRAAVAADVLAERAGVITALRHQGATVIEARPEELPEASLIAYLRAKSRARF
ncbi:MAG: DUF58 domain-containing protein [Actinomycetota bacterium]